MEMLTQKQKFIVIIVIILVIGVIAYYYINSTKDIYNYDEISSTIETGEAGETQNTENEDETDRKIVVHVTGAVKNNGIVKVKENARINDVVEAAGGLTEDANLDKVNLAYVVEDGQKIYIPKKGEGEEEKADISEEIISNSAGGIIIDDDEKASTELININKASTNELQKLPGIGASTADKIIEYRNTNGKFKKIEDLKNVSGIGDTKFNSIKNLICV